MHHESRGRSHLLLAALLALLALPAAASDVGVPSDGLDLARLDDGRVVRCVVGPEKDGKVSLQFPSGTLAVRRSRIREVRRFADFDPGARTEEEKALLARGLVRWEGRWVDRARAEQARAAENAAARKREEEDARHATWDKRWKRETEHFAIEADIGAEGLDFYAATLEDFYDFFTKVFQVKLTQREKRQKLPVYLFRQRDEFRKFHDQDTGGKSEHLLGYFVPLKGSERLVMFDSPDGRQETLDVLFHEGTHFIIYLANPQVLVSRWVHEGCAEYFGASLHAGKKFQPGQVQDGRLLHFQDMIARDKVIPMDELFRAGNPAAAGQHVEFAGEHYAQAWTLVHFLLHGRNGKYRAGFIDYVGRWLGGKGVKYHVVAGAGADTRYIEYEEDRPLLLRCLGLKDFEGLTAELVEYAKALPLRSARAYAMRGEMRFEKGDAKGAEEDFRTALEKGGQDPSVLAEMARVFSWIPGREADVAEMMRRALEADPLDVVARWRLSRRLPPEDAIRELRLCIEIEPGRARALGDLAWMLYEHRMGEHVRAVSEQDLATAREAIGFAERAVALEPEHRDYDTLAALRLCTGSFEKARDAAEKAVEMSPEEKDYIFHLAQAHAVLGDAEKFAKLLRRMELLLRRTSVAPGETEAGAPPAMTPEQAREVVARVLALAVERCFAWEKYVEAAYACGSWFERRPPVSEEEWVMYATIVSRKGEKKRAARIASEGLKAFPDSFMLRPIVEEGAAAGEDPAPGAKPAGTGGEGPKPAEPGLKEKEGDGK